MMDLDTPETCRGWQNILRISLHQVGFSLLESKYYSDRDRTRKRMTYKSVFDSRQNKNLFIFFEIPMSEMGPTKTHIQKLSGANFSGIKRLVREASSSAPTGARITNAWVCKTTPLYVSVAWCLISNKHKLDILHYYFTTILIITLETIYNKQTYSPIIEATIVCNSHTND